MYSIKYDWVAVIATKAKKKIMKPSQNWRPVINDNKCDLITADENFIHYKSYKHR